MSLRKIQKRGLVGYICHSHRFCYIYARVVNLSSDDRTLFSSIERQLPVNSCVPDEWAIVILTYIVVPLHPQHESKAADNFAGGEVMTRAH